MLSSPQLTVWPGSEVGRVKSLIAAALSRISPDRVSNTMSPAPVC